jgi:hypothetical protein
MAAPGPSCRGTNSRMDTLPIHPKTEANQTPQGYFTSHRDTPRDTVLS